MQTIMCEMDEPQAPTVDQRELYSTSCEYMFNIRITESLHCKQKSAQHCKSTIFKKNTYIWKKKERKRVRERDVAGFGALPLSLISWGTRSDFTISCDVSCGHL